MATNLGDSLKQKVYLAHSKNKTGKTQSMVEHSLGVKRRAETNSKPFGEEERAGFAALIHDIGKYGDKFQLRLDGLEHGLDHWSVGAWIALAEYRAIDVSLAIQGHHIGLQKGDGPSLREMDPKRLTQHHPLGLRLSEENVPLLKERLLADNLMLPSPVMGSPSVATSFSAMLDTRFLFAALVDADFLDTEEHMKDDGGEVPYRDRGLDLRPALALARLEEYLAGLDKKSSDEVRQMRADLLEACRSAGREKRLGKWTLTAPTGSGKTLAMLAFSLEHAIANDLRRVVVVLPFLTIIDQTAKTYREVFPEKTWGTSYVLEHHSLSVASDEGKLVGGVEQDSENAMRRRTRLLTENWDAPIIVTTSVQLLESLFANRPSACRKLHNLAKSVVLFDEVQTLPLTLAIPTLTALSRLSEPKFKTTIVFATATQPAFTHLHDSVQEDGENSGWQPKEIAPPSLNLYGRARRTWVDWTRAQTATSWETVADWIADRDQALCVVNLKRHAFDLTKLVQQKKEIKGVCHMSTAMCPAHRRKLVESITSDLANEKPCRLISTQCVEAGVDVDFPFALRSFGPLDSIAQVAGRCNRNGNLRDMQGNPLLGEMRIFLPENDGMAFYPPGGYEQAAAVTATLLNSRQHRGETMDIYDPELFDTYFRQLYDLSQTAKISKEWEDVRNTQDYVRAADLYRLIDNRGVNVVVPYDEKAFDQLADEVRDRGLTRDWIRRARPYTVNYFVKSSRGHAVLPTWLEAIYMAKNGQTAPDWFLCPMTHYYDSIFGLLPPEGGDSLFA